MARVPQGVGPGFAQVVILVGATGDLSRRKLLPGLFHLATAGFIPGCRIIGVSLDDMDADAFRLFARAALDEFSTRRMREDDWSGFAETLDYVPLSAGAEVLKAAVERAEASLGVESRRVHYLSVPPNAALSAVGLLRQAGLVEHSRVIMEKPFGTDLASAVALNARLHEVFREEQIFRIDHFLGKEPAQNILAFRFANGLFEPIWNRNFIDHVQIDVPETLALGKRIAFYEATGAFRDMVVTHLFQILGFMAMEPPTALEPRPISEEKNKVFRSMLPIDPAHVVRGQYAGYRAEEGVDPESDTETFIALKCMIDNWRWAGVPFFLRTGKRMAEGSRIISIAFREPPKSMFPTGSGVGAQGPDHLTFDLADASKMSLSFYGKRPGPGMRLDKLSLQFAMNDTGRIGEVLEAYERLILDAMRGDHTLFTTAEGIERLWELSAPLLDAPAAGAAVSAGVLGAEIDPPACGAACLAAAVRAGVAGSEPDGALRSDSLPVGLDRGFSPLHHGWVSHAKGEFTMKRRNFLAAGAGLAGARMIGSARAATPANVIRFVPQADLSSIDPVWTTATVAFTHGMMVYDSLYAVDEALTPQPQMVAGHEISDDKLTWIFTLRDGLLFHDNEKVRAIDCVASINRWGKRKGFGQKLLAVTEEIRALDDKRFQIRLKTPFPLMTFALGGPDICLIMPQRSAEVDPFKQITDTVGSGPFRFLPGERVSGSFVAYSRFDKYVPRQEKPSYWAGGKKVNVDRVEWQVIPDPATAANALQQGEVDWLESPLFDLLASLRKARGVQLFAVDPLFSPSVIALNHTQPPFDNPKLLQAILPAINQTEFMTAVVGDQTELMNVPNGIFTPGTPMANAADIGVFSGPRDLAKARRMVAESGYKGEKVVIMRPSDQAVLIPMAEMANSVFTQIGLNTDMQTMDWGTLVGRRANDKPSAEGGWNSFCTSWGGLSLSNPGSHFPLRGNGKGGWFGWPNSPTLESLRDQWFSAPDEAAQKKICEQMQSVAFKEVPYIPIGSYRLPGAMRANVADIVRAGSICFWGVRKT